LELLLKFAVAWVLTSGGFWSAFGGFAKWFIIIVIIGWPIGWVMLQLGLDHLPRNNPTHGVMALVAIVGFLCWVRYS
jgi:hypothetical protein